MNRRCVNFFKGCNCKEHADGCNNKETNKILITGSTGLVGSACMDFFAAKNWETVGIDNNQRAKMLGTPDKGVSFGGVDIRDEKKIEQLFSLIKFDAVIHTAAQPSHGYSHDHVMEDFDINARATVFLLEMTRKYCPEAVFVFCSTDKVYGEKMRAGVYKDLETRVDNPHPFDEKLGLDFARHRSPFGCSKATADIYVQEYRNTFGLKTVCFRLGCITGKNHEGAELHGFLAYLVKCIKNEIPYKIFGFKGKQVRDQIHANDLASAFYVYIENPKGDVYNMGGGPERSVSIIEAIALIIDELKKPYGWKPKIEYHEPRAGDRIWDVHDVSKFRADYPSWEYKYSLQDIIKDLCTK